MSKFHFFISYCRADGMDSAHTVARLLQEKGYSVWIDDYEVRAGSDYVDAIVDAISNCDCFIPIITKRYTSSNWAKDELNYALTLSKDRSKRIIPLIFTAETLPIDLQIMLGSMQCHYIDDPDKMINVIDSIDKAFGNKLKSDILYAKLTEYSRLHNDNRVAEVICQLIELICIRWNEASNVEYRKLQGLCKEILRLYLRLEKYIGNYDDDSRKIAHKIIDTMNRVEELLNSSSERMSGNLFIRQIYFAAFAIRILYLDREIRKECADILTNGDVRNACPIDWYVKRQSRFTQAYTSIFEETKDSINEENGYCQEDITFIIETPKYIFTDKDEDTESPENIRFKKSHEEPLSEEDEILVSVAKFMQEGNKLFDVLQSHGIAGDFLKCLLTSYERLKSYCEIVGAKNVAADCVDRILEIHSAIEKADIDTIPNERVENGIKSLLGFTLRRSGNYDVFISFKSEDADLAETIYKYCQRNLKEPFWSKRTLPQLSKSEYEDAIYDAIRKSKHFIVVLSSLDYLNANWIKREMAAFDRAITEGRKQNANFVFVVTDHVYRQIIDSNKMCLDERYCGYQIIKMSEFENSLIEYIV